MFNFSTNWEESSTKTAVSGCRKKWLNHHFHHLVNFFPGAISILGIVPFVGQTCQKAPLCPSCHRILFLLFHRKKKGTQTGHQCESRCQNSKSGFSPGLRCVNSVFGTNQKDRRTQSRNLNESVKILKKLVESPKKL